MTRKTQLHIICILLTVAAVAMIIIGIKMNTPPPTITGVGFLLIVWALSILNKNIK